MSAQTLTETSPTPRRRRDVRWIPILAAFIVGAASFTLSFFAQSEVAARLGAVPGDLAWLVPVTIDGGILAGSASVWASSSRRAKKDWVAYFTVASLLTLSVVINVHHASAAGGLLGAVIAGTPPVILLLCIELVAAQARRDALAPQEELALAAAPPVTEPVKTSVTRPTPSTFPSFEVPAPVTTPVIASTGVVASTSTPSRVSSTLPLSSDQGTAKLNGAQLNGTQPKLAPHVPSPAAPVKVSAPQTPVKVADLPAVPATAPAKNSDTPPPAKTPPSSPESAGDLSGLSPVARQAVDDTELTQAERVRILFHDHVTTGGDPQDPAISRTIAETLDAPLPSVRKVISQERKALTEVS